MVYTRIFSDSNNFDRYRNTTEPWAHHCSLCLDAPADSNYDDSIFIKAIYSVSSTSEPTKILSSTSGILSVQNLSNKITTIETGYTFNSIGNNTVFFNIAEDKIYLDTFNECENLISVKLPESLRTIGSNAFSDCTKLEIDDINLPNLTSIGSFSFRNTKVKQITNLGSIQTINTGVFKNCSQLESVVLPETVASIKNDAFLGCGKLQHINLQQSITSIGSNAFSDCTKLEIDDINLPNLTSIGSFSFRNTKVKQITNLGSIQKINTAAFKDCSQLTSVVLPETLTTIVNESFYKCTNLQHINLPQSITSIGSNAFCDCPNLSFDIINLPNLTSLGSFSFQKDKIKQITNLGSIKTINTAAFKNCTQLMSVVLPETLTTIANDVFYSCSSLTNFSYSGTMEQWGQITLESHWNTNCPFTVVHCSDGDVTL